MVSFFVRSGFVAYDFLPEALTRLVLEIFLQETCPGRNSLPAVRSLLMKDGDLPTRPLGLAWFVREIPNGERRG